MTLDELATRTGQALSDLARWRDLGLLADTDDGFAPENRERVRLIRFALDRGYTPEKLAEISHTHGDMIGAFAASFGRQRGQPVCTVAEAVARVGLDPDVFDRLRKAAGLGDEHDAYEEDLEVIRIMQTALDAGLPVNVLTEIVCVFATATEKIADGASRLFHLHIHEQMRAGGAGGAELLEATNAIGEPLLELVEPAVMYFHRKAWERALAEDMMLHLAEEATPRSQVPGEFVRAFLFVDLSSFTPMTEVMGDEAAAEVVERFAELVRESSSRCSGQVVKQIGDEFMLVFPDGRSAAACGLALQDRAAAEHRFPALRLGAHVGSVLFREGDYVGTVVNTAARVAASATRHQFLVTSAVADGLGDLEAEVVDHGARALKGLSGEVQLFELLRPGSRERRDTDPVCGMELDPEASDAELTWEGRRLQFCSEDCLRRFLQNPERYTA